MKAFISAFRVSLIFLSLSVTAQKAPIKFGDVSLADLKLTRYEKDSSASAVVLVDYGQSSVNYMQNTGFTLTFERITRIKILNEDGLDQANFEVRLYHDNGMKEEISSIKGITHNAENGQIVQTKLKSDGIIKEKYDALNDVVKITLPNVKVGSVIDITYTIVSDFLVHFQDWEFQSTIPVIWSEYRASVPEFFSYDKYTQGYIPLVVNESKDVMGSITLMERGQSPHTITYQDKRSRWAAEHVPAFKEEPYMTTYKDFISKLNFELAYIQMPQQPIKPMLGDWAEINKKFADLYEPEIKGNNYLTKTVESLIAGLTTEEAKINAICSFVKNNVAWDGYNAKYFNSNLKQVLESKKGNAAEINLLMASMIEKAGIVVSPVLLSTRDHGMIRQATPSSNQFNYVICRATADGKQYLLDATEKLLPSSLIPKKCINGMGLIVRKEVTEWTNLETKFKSRTTTSAEVALTPEGELAGKIKLDCNGYAALSHRKGYLVKGEQDYIKEFIGIHDWERKASEFQNTQDVQKNFVEVHDLIVRENITTGGEVVYVDPFIMNGIKANPFKAETREYPVDFGAPEEQTFVYKLTVPDNYTIDEAPVSKVMMLPENGARYMYNVTVNGNVINITSILSINKGMFTQLEYPDLREFYNQVVAKQSEQIVLKKKL